MKTLVFYYFGMRIVFNPDEELANVDGQYWDLHHLRPVLQNEILYRMQDNVHVAPDGCRTFREVFDTRRGKWSDVLVPMLVNMQAETSKVVDAALYGAEEFPDVPY